MSIFEQRVNLNERGTGCQCSYMAKHKGNVYIVYLVFIFIYISAFLQQIKVY